MIGIPCEEPVYIYGDNQSVLVNMTIPNSTFNKKLQNTVYYLVRERSARYEWWMLFFNTHENEADLLTKLLLNGEKRKGFIRRILHHIFHSNVGVDESWGGIGCVQTTPNDGMIIVDIAM